MLWFYPNKLKKDVCGDHTAPSTKKEEEEDTEDWNGNRQEDQSRHHHPQNLHHQQTYDVPDRYSEQIRLRREWDEKMEHLNAKLNLDYYSSL